MNIITALGNPILNKELNNLNTYNILAPDIQYQDGVIEILEEKSNINLLILSELLPGDFSIYDFINEIKKINKELKIIIVLENKKEELENFLISKGIFNFFYNNQITVDEIILIINSENNFNNINKYNVENKIIKYTAKKGFKLNKKEKKESIIISILGSHGSGKSIFSINLAKSFKNKKVLLIDFDIFYSSIHSILGIKKNPINNNEHINLEDIILKINKNFHIINNIDVLFPNTNLITNTEIKNLLIQLKYKYDYILIDTSSEINFEATRFIIRYSNHCIFLLEGNILEIKKSKLLLNFYLENWYIKKEKINIVINKYNKNSISINLLKHIFSDFTILGKIKYDDIYNLLINRSFNSFLQFQKIKKQYKIIINNLSVIIFENKLKNLGKKNNYYSQTY